MGGKHKFSAHIPRTKFNPEGRSEKRCNQRGEEPSGSMTRIVCFRTEWRRRDHTMKTAGRENPNSRARLVQQTEFMGRKARTIPAQPNGLESKKQSGRRRGVFS
jgi:hypothetical protein